MGMAKAKTGKSEHSKSKSKSTQSAFKKAHMKRFLRFYSPCRVSSTAATSLSNFLSIIVQEVLQSSVKQTIKPIHINNAIRHDEDLKALFKDCVLKNGGYEK